MRFIAGPHTDGHTNGAELHVTKEAAEPGFIISKLLFSAEDYFRETKN